MEGGGGLPGSLAPDASVAWPASGLPLSEIAGLVLEASVPRFADAVAVFALEGLRWADGDRIPAVRPRADRAAVHCR